MKKLFHYVKWWEEEGKREKGTIFISFVDDDDYHPKVYHVNTFISLITSAEFSSQIKYLIFLSSDFFKWIWKSRIDIDDNDFNLFKSVIYLWRDINIWLNVRLLFISFYIILSTKFKKIIMNKKIYSIYSQFIVMLNSISIKFNM